ncbi:MAG: hypothetical protein LBU27_06090 [Candidatus Peribacteria bacterium]|nr:hypothetical protein [Candidatus Peribacteria bacterium]
MSRFSFIFSTKSSILSPTFFTKSSILSFMPQKSFARAIATKAIAPVIQPIGQESIPIATPIHQMRVGNASHSSHIAVRSHVTHTVIHTIVFVNSGLSFIQSLRISNNGVIESINFLISGANISHNVITTPSNAPVIYSKDPDKLSN